jgi:hypothetical protein
MNASKAKAIEVTSRYVFTAAPGGD